MDKKWRLYPQVPNDLIASLPEIDPLIWQLLYNRGLEKEEDIKLFLNPQWSFNNDPWLFSDMGKAIDLIIKHLKAQNKIVIYGDYDADGVTSSALLFDVLQVFRADVEIYIPNRVSEGYGVNQEAVDEILARGAKLMITVDTGIRNKEVINYAQEKGLAVVLTDHHVLPELQSDLPSCPIINPSNQRDSYPFHYLAGVGVAFKLCQALISKSKLESDLKEKLEQRNLDLVAVGTIADCVSLLGENRVLVKKGLEILNQRKRLGLRELMKVAKISMDKELDSFNVGFQLAPRLNAASRVGNVNTALNLLTGTDMDEVKKLALKLNQRNIERQKITEEIMKEVESQIDVRGDNGLIIGLSSEEQAWNEGVIGLVAGKISDKYYRPCLIITKTDEGYKGSGRSIRELDLMEAVTNAAQHLEKYGGHKMACGFSVSPDKLESFITHISDYVSEKLKGLKLIPQIDVDAVLDLNNVNLNLIKNVSLLAPFGQDNPRPTFASYGVKIQDIMTMGDKQQHIKFKLNGLWAIVFGQAQRFADIKVGDEVDLVYYLDINDFNGRQEAQLRLIDLKLAQINDYRNNNL